MRKLFIATLLAIMSLSVWGQSKLSPYTRHYVERVKNEKVADGRQLKSPLQKKINSRGQLVIPAFVYLNEGYSPDILIPCGVEVRSVIGQILTADIPFDALDEVAALEGVKYVEMGTPVVPRLDEARKDALVDKVQTGVSLPGEYRGNGVVVGVVDNGFDYTHPNFYTRDKSKLRIKRVWDQNASGTAPEGFGYGCEYTTAEAILAKGYDTDQTTHGTHVLGIATGADNTDEKGVYGVATDADIVLVSYNSKNMYTGDNTAIIDGVKYIFDYAQSVGKPCVVNLSLGSYLGPHDGSSTFDQLADELQGSGRLLVGSSGNSGGKKYHLSKTFEGNKTDTLATFFDFNYTYGQYGTVEVWCDPGMDITFVPITYNPTENKVQKAYEPARFNATQCENKTYNFDTNIDGVWGSLVVEGEINPINGKTHLVLSPDFYSISNYDRGFYIISSNPGTINLWTDEYTTLLSSFDRPGFIDGDDQSSIDEIGGTGKRIISVGAYVTRDHSTQYGIPAFSGETLNALATFSSKGPTADGRVKPEITAPGTYIISSLSSYYTSSKLKYSSVTWNGKSYDFGYMQGTSMASPFITGVLATWLQAFPGLTPEYAREIMQTTARYDSFTGESLPSNLWGYGKINAYEGIKECIRYESAIEPNRVDNPHMVIADGNSVRVVMGCADNSLRMQLYNLQGACVASQVIDNACAGEELTFGTDDLASGIYLLQLSGDNTRLMVKKIIIQ